MAAKVRDYALSELYYLQNDPEIAPAFHAEMQNWGLPKDEFVDNGNFPFQFYVREARRMVGQYVLRESDITQDRYKPDGICEGSYGVDCHAIQELTIDGKKVIDHTPHINVAGYDIPYACLTPQDKPGLPTNLLVPVCLSTTHVAYCSVRMEPVYMMLGHAAERRFIWPWPTRRARKKSMSGSCANCCAKKARSLIPITNRWSRSAGLRLTRRWVNRCSSRRRPSRREIR